MAQAETGMCGEKMSLCKGAGTSMASWSRSRSRASSRTRGCNRNYAAGRGDVRRKRPRSSPDRSNNSDANVFNAVAFYSPTPPSTPLYLIPVQPVSSVSAKPKKPTEQHKTEGTKKESMKIARHVTRSLLRAVEKAVAARAKTLDAATGPQCDSLLSTNNAKDSSTKLIADVASQTSQNIATVGKPAETDAKDPSISSEDQCEEGRSTGEWAGDVRALRDSHVQLVLRQLEQLRNIERLDRALRRACITPLQRAPPAAECGDPSPACLARST